MELAAAVRKIAVRKFSKLESRQRSEFAQAVAEKGAEIPQSAPGADGRIFFEKDRHEGNFLLVTNSTVLEKLGINDGKLILVIDFAQVAQIDKGVRESLVESTAVVGALQHKMPKLDRAKRELFYRFNNSLFARRSPQFTDRQLADRLSEALESTQLNPADALARVLVDLEADGFTVRDEVWDYLTALDTMGTWEKHRSGNAFTRTLVSERILVKASQSARRSWLNQEKVSQQGLRPRPLNRSISGSVRRSSPNSWPPARSPPPFFFQENLIYLQFPHAPVRILTGETGSQLWYPRPRLALNWQCAWKWFPTIFLTELISGSG